MATMAGGVGQWRFIDAHIRVTGGRATQRSLQAAKDAFHRTRTKTMREILYDVVIPAVKRQVRGKFKRGKRFRKIALPQVAEIESATDILGRVFPRVGFMGVFETGGTVYPNTSKRGQSGKPRKYFKIPLPGARNSGVPSSDEGSDLGPSMGSATFIKKSKRGNLIIFRRNYGSDITPIFVLKKKITLPRRPIFGPAADSVAAIVAARMGDAYMAALTRGR